MTATGKKPKCPSLFHWFLCPTPIRVQAPFSPRNKAEERRGPEESPQVFHYCLRGALWSVLGNKKSNRQKPNRNNDISEWLYTRAPSCNKRISFSQILKTRVRVSLNGKHPVFCREPRIRVAKNHAEGPGRLKLPDPQAGPRSLHIFGGTGSFRFKR